MIDNEVTLSNDEEIAETFNKYFGNIAKNLSLPLSPSIKVPSVELFTDPVILALGKYNDHPSITSIKNKMTSMNNPKFSFRFLSLNETLNGVNKLNRKKASQATDITVKIIKENKDVISVYRNGMELANLTSRYWSLAQWNYICFFLSDQSLHEK